METLEKPMNSLKDIKENNVLTFHDGILGFEDCKRYVIVSLEEVWPFEWLLSTDNPTIGFPIVNPLVFCPDYAPNVPVDELEALEIEEPTDVEMFCIATIANNDLNEATVNLKGPIIVNTAKNIAKQVVLCDDVYSVHHPIQQIRE
jgi:flagellar assembly factor FliW